jgi:hypothetical protein
VHYRCLDTNTYTHVKIPRFQHMTHGCNIDALFKCEETNATLLQTTNIQT